MQKLFHDLYNSFKSLSYQHLAATSYPTQALGKSQTKRLTTSFQHALANSVGVKEKPDKLL